MAKEEYSGTEVLRLCKKIGIDLSPAMLSFYATNLLGKKAKCGWGNQRKYSRGEIMAVVLYVLPDVIAKNLVNKMGR